MLIHLFSPYRGGRGGGYKKLDEQDLEETKRRRGEAEEVIAYASNAEFFVTSFVAFSSFINVYKSFLSSLYSFCLAFLKDFPSSHIYMFFIDICDPLLFENFFIKTYKSSSCTFNNILKFRFIRNYSSVKM